MENYYNVSEKEAKKMLTMIFYGGKPKDDLPFIWKLVTEVN